MNETNPNDAEQVELKTGQHYEFFYWLLMLACGSIAYLSLCFATFLICRNSDEDTSRAVIVTLAGGLASLLPFLTAYLYYGPRAFLTVKIFADRILIDRDGKQTQMGLHEVRQLGLNSFPGLGHWLTLQLKDGGRIRIAGTLFGIEILVRALEAANPSLLTAEESKALQTKLRLTDFRTARTWENLKKGRMLLLKHIIFPITVGVVAPNLFAFLRNHGVVILHRSELASHLLAQLVLSLSAAIVIWLPISGLQKFVISLNERRLPFDRLVRDRAFEAKIRLNSTLAYCLVTCAAFGIFFSFVSLNL